MAELVDALDSKSGYRKVVQVRFLFWAQQPVDFQRVFYLTCHFLDTFSRFLPITLTRK